MHMATTAMRARFPLLLLLGILFLASVSASYGALAYWEKENPCQDKCLQSCTAENDVKRHEACLARCNQARRCRPQHEEQEEDEEEHEQTPRRRHQHGHRPQWQREDEDEDEDQQEQGQRQPRRHWHRDQEQRRRQEQERKERRGDEEEEEDEDEDEDEERSPWGQRRQEQERRRREQQRQQRRQRQTEDEEEDEDEDEEERSPWGQRRQEQERRRREQERRRRQREDEEEDEDEDEEERSPWGQRRQEQERRRREQQRRERQRRRQRETEDEDDEDEDEEERSPWGQRRQEQERRRREQERRRRQREDEDEDDEERSPWGQRRQEQERRRREQQKQRRRQGETEEEEDEEQEWRGSRGSRQHQIQRRGSQSQARNNPFYFPRSRLQSLYRNEHGWIRVVQRFDRISEKLENLQNHRVLLIEARPNTLVLPKHADAESVIVIQDGEAIVHLANAEERESFNLERGDALRIPAGTISYIVNRNDNQNLRIAKLLIPVNQPGKFDDFFPANNEEQQSYFEGFSRTTLEASFNAPFSEIQRTLLQENEEEEEESGEGVIVKLSREQIQELSKHAKSSRKRGSFSSSSSESAPFSLRSRKPVHENNFGRFFEVTPNKNNPQLQDLDIHLSCAEIREGGLMLPHFNSKATVVIVVNQGRGNLELVGLRDQNQQQWREQEEDEDEQEGNKQVHRYTARLSRGDIVVIPAGHPFAINASSDLHLLGFGINAQNNQRNFLAGENDNVLNQIHRQVKELAFPGSGEQVERLFKRQRKSYFVSARPQQQQQREERWERGSGSRGPLSSILNAFY